MNLNQINKILLENSIEDEHKAAEKYYEYASKIDYLCNYKGNIYTRIDIPSQISNYDTFTKDLLISSIFSDITKIYPTNSFSAIFEAISDDKENFEDVVNSLDLKINSKDSITIRKAYSLLSDDEAEFLYNNLTPLFEMGKVTLMPNPSLQITLNSKLYQIPAQVDYKANIWKTSLFNYKQEEIPLQSLSINYNSQQSRVIEEIMVPYLSGISIKDFSLLLQDEDDLISSFRYEIKNLIKSDTNKENATEIFQDLIRPRIDKINQKFKNISNLHSFRTKGVTLCTGGLSLLSLSLGDFMQATSIILGAGGAALIKSEVDYQKELRLLRDDSMYFLWKLNYINQK